MRKISILQTMLRRPILKKKICRWPEAVQGSLVS